MTLLVTGGAGFIGANFVIDWLSRCDEPVVNLDKLTYAGNLASLSGLRDDPRHIFVHGDICDRPLVSRLLREHRVRAVINFAAESHVDRSISGPGEFIQTNILGVFSLLEEARAWWSDLGGREQAAFRFLHVSTDEVFGSLRPDDPPFRESTPFAPNSPYAASKAGADHLVRAWTHTYGLPTLSTNCSNNYGPLQFPEKLIPLMILNAIAEKPLPVYGDGRQVRDWLYVSDHCSAIRRVLEAAAPGTTWTIGGSSERANLDVIRTLCTLLDRIAPRKNGSHKSLITFVKDRPGHDRRYAVDASRLRTNLNWAPAESFDSGLEKTVRWYLDNVDWVRGVQTGAYTQWLKTQYAEQ